MSGLLLACLWIGQLVAQTVAPTDSVPVYTPAEPARLSLEASVGYLFESETESFSAGGGYYPALDNRHYLGLEVTWFEADDTETVDEVVIKSQLEAWMGLVVYRFEWPLGESGQWRLSLGAGLGASFLEITGSAPSFGVDVQSESRGDLTGQLSAGFAGQFTERWGAHLRYRHFRIWNAELFETESDFKDDLIEAGLAYRF